MKRLHLGFLVLLFILAGCCRNSGINYVPDLRSQLFAIVDSVPGIIGIAVVGQDDTITINNGVHYPLMSVFKFHEALAVTDKLEKNGNDMDSVIHVSRSEIDRETWSPMLKVVGSGDFSISIRELVDYSLKSSDNNASNILFARIVSPEETDRFMKSVAEDTTFNIRFSESEMKSEHNLSYCNYSTPLSAALLMKQLFTSDMVNEGNRNIIIDALSAVTTGQDRLGAAVEHNDDVFFAHKTGSGYRNSRGELMAHNDVGYFRMPDGTNYSIAVFIRDFSGSEEEASAIIARISRLVFDRYSK